MEIVTPQPHNYREISQHSFIDFILHFGKQIIGALLESKQFEDDQVFSHDSKGIRKRRDKKNLNFFLKSNVL